MSETKVNIKADTAEQFVDESHRAMRDKSKLGVTEYDLGAQFTIQGNTIKSARLSLKSATRRVHWAGRKHKDPDKENMAAIKKIEELNTAHEKAHRDSYQQVFNKRKADIEKDMVGKTKKEADAVLKSLRDELDDACEKLHSSEGLIKVTVTGGKISVTEGPEGPGGCAP